MSKIISINNSLKEAGKWEYMLKDNSKKTNWTVQNNHMWSPLSK